MNVPGSSPRRNQQDRYGRWIAVAGIALMVSGRFSHSGGLVLFGFAIGVVGIGLGVQAGRKYMQTYVRALIPGGARQGDPFAGVPKGASSGSPDGLLTTYLGTVVWPGGIGKGIRLELSSWGLSIEPTWLSRVLMAKRPSWELPWSAVRAVEIAKVPGTGSGPSPVKFSIAQPSTVFLFFCRTPKTLLDDAMGRREQQHPA
jgi:hypothetical protein